MSSLISLYANTPRRKANCLMTMIINTRGGRNLVWVPQEVGVYAIALFRHSRSERQAGGTNPRRTSQTQLLAKTDDSASRYIFIVTAQTTRDGKKRTQTQRWIASDFYCLCRCFLYTHRQKRTKMKKMKTLTSHVNTWEGVSVAW